jgi:hypothetical protein
MVSQEQEVANTGTLSPGINLPLEEHVAEHAQAAARKDLPLVDPASKPGASKPGAVEPARVEKRHVKAIPRIDDTTGHEEHSNTPKMRKGEFDESPQREPQVRYKATEHPEDLPCANSHPPTYMEQTRPVKRHAVTAPGISNVIRQNGHDKHSNMSITMPEKRDGNPRRPTIATEMSVTATIPAPQAIAKHEPPAIRKDSPPAVSVPAIDAVEPVHTAERTVVAIPHTTSSIGTTAGRHGHDSGALSVSREVFPARVAVGKSGGIAPASSSRILPDTSSQREAATLAPAPTINVTIGRIEVRAVAPPGPPRHPHAGSKAMSLDQYLNRNSGQRNQQG